MVIRGSLGSTARGRLDLQERSGLKSRQGRGRPRYCWGPLLGTLFSSPSACCVCCCSPVCPPPRPTSRPSVTPAAMWPCSLVNRPRL